ncbi:LOW QUALITY PROTEIN: hypothetical protein HID58_052335 [Brassica napus]|uniref:Uncharacterized protein n=1 Tax=Brassica napus TaxID=3708 RepID=A0ABQ8ABP1_BRANA|nr:LOW QUALITY PROTEIN: hypothetical protein HID58_052335 [Brassica napus]
MLLNRTNLRASPSRGVQGPSDEPKSRSKDQQGSSQSSHLRDCPGGGEVAFGAFLVSRRGPSTRPGGYPDLEKIRLRSVFAATVKDCVDAIAVD